jgi:hypothetical protein
MKKKLTREFLGVLGEFDKEVMKLDESGITEIKNSIKIRNNVKLAECITEISVQILSDTNQMKDMTFPKFRKDEKEKGESSEIRIAIKSLKSLDRLILIKNQNNQEVREEMLKEFTSKVGWEYYFINGFSYFFTNSKSKISSFPSLKNPTQINIRNKLKQNFNEGYKDYFERCESYLKDIVKDRNFPKMIGSLMEDLYDYKHTGDQKKDNLDVLYASSARRHVIIVFQAFKNLISDLTLEKKEEIFKAFLEKVFKNQEWEKHKIYTDINSEKFKLLKIYDFSSGVRKQLNEDFSKLIQEQKYSYSETLEIKIDDENEEFGNENNSKNFF